MDDWMVVTLLSLAMLVGCYLAGCIPLAFSLPEEKLKLLTIFGAGLLVGTALAIIIPEGIESMYHTHSVHHTTHNDDLPLPLKEPQFLNRNLQQVEAGVDTGQEVELARPDTDSAHQEMDHAHQEGEHNHQESQHKYIGVALVTGFVFMLLVDQVGGASHSHGGGVSSSLEGGTNSEVQGTLSHSRHRITATIGLCVHAAADGIALGAATSVKQNQLTIIVFVAIMLHKAPAAFGLVSFLLHDSMDRSRIRRHLLAFSLSAPAAYIITFCILNTQSKEWLTDYNATGLSMLFSAGTFLYVSTVHILPEVSSKTTRSTSADGTVIIREHKGFTKPELLSIVTGSILPVFISIGHSHGH